MAFLRKTNLAKKNIHFSAFFFKTKKFLSSEMTADVEKKAVDLGLLEEDDEFEEFPSKGMVL